MSDDVKNGNVDIDTHTGTPTTSHEWDGVKELNTPMPKWWIGIFYLSILWAIGYAIVMPSVPLLNGYTKGLFGWSDRVKVAEAIEEMHTDRAENAQKLIGASITQIENDPELLRFATEQGKTLFGDNCETCHGQRGLGVVGYPNLNDDIWIWGGSFEDIKYSINYGIRAEHDETRLSTMMAYGKDEILAPGQIDDLVQYVLQLSGQDADGTAALRGAALFAENCTSCHGVDGTGMRENGAPNLTDAEWLYGGDAKTVRASIFNGRAGVMPNWNERLREEQIAALTFYVHSDLGGGE